MTIYEPEEKRLELTVFVGLDAFGCGLLDHLDGMMECIDPVFKISTKFTRIGDDAGRLPGEIRARRAEVSTLSNIDAIRKARWQLKNHTVRVRNVFVGECQTASKSLQVIADYRKEYPADRSELWCFHKDYEDAEIRELIPDIRNSFDTSIFLSGVNIDGAAIEEGDVKRSAAGALLLSLICSDISQADADEEGSLSCFGFSGFYGAVGEIRTLLDIRYAIGILNEEVKPLKHGEDEHLPEKVKLFLEICDPRRLGKEFFYDSLSHGSVRKELNAQAEWSDSTLCVTIDRGLIGLETTRLGRMEHWVDEIRRRSRSLDMIVAYRWRMQLEAGAYRMIEKLAKEVPAVFTSILERTPRGPAWAEKSLELINEKLQEQLAASAEAMAGVEKALAELDAAIRTSPNVFMLCLRVALWFIPALIAGTGIVYHLYDDSRSYFFASAFALMLPSIAVGWIVWKVIQSSRALEKARQRAIDAVALRQEAILAENTVEYLKVVLNAVRSMIANDCQGLLKQFKAMLTDASSSLNDLVRTTRERIHGGVIFNPVIEREEEISDAFLRLNIDVGKSLEQSLEGGCFALERGREGNDSLSNILLGWCHSQLDSNIQKGDLELVDLWTIRTDRRNDTDPSIFERLWKLATPLVPGCRAKSEHRGIAIGPPQIIQIAEQAARDGKSTIKADSKKIDHFQLFCFYRGGYCDFGPE